jgi:hypothetical protein
MRDDNISQEKAATENNSYITYLTLTDEELVTYLHFSKFLHRDGFTTASDKYLAEKRRCSIDKIQRNLKSLEDKGIIYRETWKEGMYWKRRIWLAEKYAEYLIANDLDDPKFKKCLRIRKNAYFDSAKMRTSTPQKCVHNKRSTKRKKNTTTEPKESSAAPPDSSLFSADKPWIKKVKKEAPEEVEAFISYAKAHKHEADILERWLMACATKKYWRTAAPSPEEKKEKHKKIAKWIVKNYPRADIVEGYNYLEFINGMNATHVKFGDKSFEEICEKELKRRGLDLLFQA